MLLLVSYLQATASQIPTIPQRSSSLSCIVYSWPYPCSILVNWSPIHSQQLAIPQLFHIGKLVFYPQSIAGHTPPFCIDKLVSYPQSTAGHTHTLSHWQTGLLSSQQLAIPPLFHIGKLVSYPQSTAGHTPPLHIG